MVDNARMRLVGWLAAAGMLGTLARWGISLLAVRLFGDSLWGTLAVNAAGCLAFGAVAGLAEGRQILGPDARVVILVGFLGAFTTFSSYAFEAVQLLRDGRWATALAYFAAQNAIGLTLVVLGLRIARVP